MKRYLVGFILGLLIPSAFFITTGFVKSTDKKQDVDAVGKEKNYPYLAKRIFFEQPNDAIINFTDLRKQLTDYVSNVPEKTGVYFEYLPTGIHIGVLDREPFYRASLVKIPMVMSLYKFIEQGKIKKDEQLEIKRGDIDNLYGSLWKKGEGQKVKVNELIELALTESDNTAYNVLFNRLQLEAGPGEESIDHVYDFLDIPRKENETTVAISPRNYGSILKSLFFSSYITVESSSEILNYLVNSKFKGWQRAAVPENIPVAHKVGIYDIEKNAKSVHSDCGIVYFPQRPYLLCVMVNSENFGVSSKYIQDISKMVYTYVSTVNLEK